MVKIPTVERQVQLAAGSLGPRANTGAFTAPGRAAANFAETASDVVTNFAKMEAEEEDNRIKREEYGNAFDLATEHVFADKSTNTTDAKKSFDAFEKKLMGDIDKKGYSKRRSNLVKGHMFKMLAQQKFNAKNEAFKRGHFQSGVAASSDVSKIVEQIKTFPVGSTMRDFLESEARRMVEIDETKGYSSSAYNYDSSNLTKTLDDLKSDSIRSNLQNEIRAASSPEQLSEIESKIKNNPDLEAPEESVLFSQIDGQKTKIKSNLIATAANHIDVQNIGENDFSTIEAAQAKFEKAKNGDFGNNTEAQAIWDSSDEATRATIVGRMQENVRDSERRLSFLNSNRDRKEKIANEQIFVEKISAVRKGDVSIEDIQELEFVGQGGEILREQMTSVAVNAATNPPRSTSNIQIDNAINQKVQKREITSLTQKFKLAGETEPLSILEREHLQLSSSRVDDYFNLFRVESSERERRQESKITELLKSKELRVRGSSLLVSRPTGASDERMEIFSAFVRQSIKEGLEDGKNFDDLINPLSSNYVLKEDVLLGFVPSKATLQNEAKDLFGIKDNISGFSREDVLPPTNNEMGLPANASPSQIESHPLFRAWENSFKGFVFKELTQ